MRIPPVLALAGALAVSFVSSFATPVSVTVSAAASLADVLEAATHAYATSHPDVELVFNYGGSGALQKQIENGAPVDAFLSAAAEPMAALAKARLVGPSKVIAGNTLVAFVRPFSTPGAVSRSYLPFRTLADLDQWPIKVIAIGDPASVPAGKYAQQALTKLGLWDKLKPRFVMTKDVRQAAAYVVQGNAQAAFVYATDVPPAAVGSEGDRIVLTVPDDAHSPIVYPAAILTKAAHPKEAQAFLDFLAGPEGQALFKKFGFAPAP